MHALELVKVPSYHEKVHQSGYAITGRNASSQMMECYFFIKVHKCLSKLGESTWRLEGQQAAEKHQHFHILPTLLPWYLHLWVFVQHLDLKSGAISIRSVHRELLLLVESMVTDERHHLSLGSDGITGPTTRYKERRVKLMEVKDWPLLAWPRPGKLHPLPWLQSLALSRGLQETPLWKPGKRFFVAQTSCAR